MPRPSRHQAPRRTHALGACHACRRRHLKCDQAKPVCSRCKSSGRTCETGPKEIRWMPLGGPRGSSDEHVIHHETPQSGVRKAVDSYQVRSTMGKVMKVGIPTTIDAALDDLDNRSVQSNQTLSVGPFHVLNLDNKATNRRSASPALLNIPSQGQTTQSNNSIDKDSNVPLVSSDEPEGAFPQGDISLIPTDLLQWDDLFTWDIDASLQVLGTLSAGTSLEREGWSQQRDDLELIPYSDGPTIDPSIQVADHFNGRIHAVGSPISADLLKEAPMLLKHFEHDVIHQMSSLPVYEKVPWKIMNIPTAIVTLSELTVLVVDHNMIKHAHLANLYGLLSVASYHISMADTIQPEHYRPAGYWASIHAAAYDAAKMHVDASIEGESQGKHKAKYKEQLMAFNATLATSFVSNNQIDVGRYLHELEKLIRVRGLTKRVISRRARLLHHLYAWVRIVSESTRTQPLDSSVNGIFKDPISKRYPNRTEPNMNDSNIVPDMTVHEFLRLEPDSPINRRDVRSEGPDNEIAIDLPGTINGKDSLYMQIYGIPETWLRLLSQTHRLADKMDRQSLPTNGNDAKAFTDLQVRATQLEQSICIFTKTIPAPDAPRSSTKPSHEPHSHMLRALCSSLLIYFYRRIRHVNPLILQSTINDVIEALKDFDSALSRQGLECSGTSWPAFIAGCESMSTPQRQQILDWIDTRIVKSGFQSYATAKEIMTSVWQRRDETSSTYPSLGSGGELPVLVTWVEVCRETNRWPILC